MLQDIFYTAYHSTPEQEHDPSGLVCYRYWCISCGTCLSRLVATKNLQNFATREQLPRSHSKFSLLSVLRLTFGSARLSASKNVAPCLSTTLGSSRTFENKHAGNCIALSAPFLHQSPSCENSDAQPWRGHQGFVHQDAMCPPSRSWTSSSKPGMHQLRARIHSTDSLPASEKTCSANSNASSAALATCDCAFNMQPINVTLLNLTTQNRPIVPLRQKCCELQIPPSHPGDQLQEIPNAQLQRAEDISKFVMSWKIFTFAPAAAISSASKLKYLLQALCHEQEMYMICFLRVHLEWLPDFALFWNHSEGWSHELSNIRSKCDKQMLVHLIWCNISSRISARQKTKANRLQGFIFLQY